MQVLVEGVQEQGRSRMKGELRRFTTVDNHEAVTHGDLEWPLVCPEAAVREGAEELTLRRGEEGGLRTFVDATNVGDSRCGPPLVDKDWHAICQDIFKGIGGEQWERMFSSGRTNRRVWVVTGKWARRSTGCIIVWRGEKSETRSQRTWGNGNHQCSRRWPGIVEHARIPISCKPSFFCETENVALFWQTDVHMSLLDFWCVCGNGSLVCVRVWNLFVGVSVCVRILRLACVCILILCLVCVCVCKGVSLQPVLVSVVRDLS